MRRPMTEPSAVTAGTPTYSGGHCKRFALSSIHGASASGMNSKLNGSTANNPFGSGFGSGHTVESRSVVRAREGARAVPFSSAECLLSSRIRSRASIDSCVALSMQIKPDSDQHLHFNGGPCARNVGLESLQSRRRFVQLRLAEFC